MKRIVLFFILFLAFGTVFAQNRFPGGDGDGQVLTISAGMDNTAFEGLGLKAGFVIEDFLFIGGDWNMDFITLGEKPGREIYLGICATAALLKADEFFPVSCNVTGSFRKISFTGAYLEENEYVKSGTGFSVEGDIFRDFSLSIPGFIRAGITGGYTSSTYTTEPAGGLSDYSEKQFEENINYWYGLIAGASFVVTEKMVLSVELRGSLDKDFHILYGPAVSIAGSKSKMDIKKEKEESEE